MTWVSFLCFGVCFGIVVSCFYRGSDVLSPARVFGFVWCLAIGLAELKLSALQHTWSAESWIQLLVGPASFLLGVFILYVRNLDEKLLSVDLIRKKWKTERTDENRLFLWMCVAFVLYVYAYVVIAWARGGIPLFSSHPGEARMEFSMFAIGLFLHHLVVILFFTVVYHLTVKGQSARKWWLKLFSVVVLVSYFLTLQRLQIVMTIVIILTLVYYTSRHLRLGTVGGYSALIIALVYVVSNLRWAGQYFIYYLYRDSRMKFPPQYAIFTEPYMYVAMNLENFARSMDRLDHFTFGYYTFDFVTALSGLKHWLDDYIRLNETPYLISSYNTYTAFWTYYRDFGVLGVFAIGLLGGLAIGCLYYAMRKKPTLSSISAYSIAVFLMGMSFFNSQIGFLWFVYSVVAMYAVLQFIRPRVEPRVVLQ